MKTEVTYYFKSNILGIFQPFCDVREPCTRALGHLPDSSPKV